MSVYSLCDIPLSPTFLFFLCLSPSLARSCGVQGKEGGDRIQEIRDVISLSAAAAAAAGQAWAPGLSGWSWSTPPARPIRTSGRARRASDNSVMDVKTKQCGPPGAGQRSLAEPRCDGRSDSGAAPRYSFHAPTADGMAGMDAAALGQPPSHRAAAGAGQGPGGGRAGA